MNELFCYQVNALIVSMHDTIIRDLGGGGVHSALNRAQI